MNRFSLIRTVTLLTTSTILMASVSFKATGSGAAQNQTPAQTRPLTPAQRAKVEEAKIISVNIRGIARILKAEGVDLEPGLLFTANGKRKLRPKLLAFPEMYLSKDHSGPLRGVVMADILTLPEKVNIEGDTVIIAKHIIFTGRAPLIKGAHELHLFALDSAKVTNGKGTVVTIDTSGLGRKEWLESQRQAAATSKRGRVLANHAVRPFQNSSGTPGADGNMGTVGSNGSTGNHGTAGNNGSCSLVKNGGNGTLGSAGTAGGNGGNGTNGIAGNPANNQTININNINAGGFNVIANGGAGGNGGPGGFAGIGGTGGNGGKGGTGASCNCAAGGLGAGGNGGNAGAGGNGGNGGQGGNGANGGAGGSVVINFPWGYDVSQGSVSTQAGTGGQGGLGGQSNMGGSAGSPGAGGHGGSVFGCDAANDGTAGNPASGGAGGSGGNGGNPGQPGGAGSISWNMTGGPDTTGGGGDPTGWEPGMTYQSCTEWFLVSFHCDYLIDRLTPKEKKFLANHARSLLTVTPGWQCYETGREYIGCF